MHQAATKNNAAGTFFGQGFIRNISIAGKAAGKSSIVLPQMVCSPGRFISKNDNGRPVIQFSCCMYPDVALCPGITAFFMQNLQGAFIRLSVFTAALGALHVIVRNAEIIICEPYDPV